MQRCVWCHMKIKFIFASMKRNLLSPICLLRHLILWMNTLCFVLYSCVCWTFEMYCYCPGSSGKDILSFLISVRLTWFNKRFLNEMCSYVCFSVFFLSCRCWKAPHNVSSCVALHKVLELFARLLYRWYFLQLIV